MTLDTPSLENETISLLDELSSLQDELFHVLAEKHRRMVDADASPAPDDEAESESLESRELSLCDKLRECHDRRAVLLDNARQRGLPGDSIASLAPHLESENPGELESRVKTAAGRMRLLQHQSLTNWVVAQRSLLHVTQLLEIIATGGAAKADIWSRDQYAIQWWFGRSGSVISRVAKIQARRAGRVGPCGMATIRCDEHVTRTHSPRASSLYCQPRCYENIYALDSKKLTL